MRGTKVQFITDWAQRVNGSYSLFNIEKLWTLGGSMSYCSAFCRRAESLSLASTCRGETDRQGGRGEPAASVGFAVAMETMSSLLDTCFWWHHAPGLSTHSKRFSSIPSPNPRDRPLVCVWWWEEGVVWDNNEELLRQKHRYAVHLCCESSQACQQPDTHRPSSHREGYICICLLQMWLVSLFSSSWVKSFVAGRWGRWAFWVFQ